MQELTRTPVMALTVAALACAVAALDGCASSVAADHGPVEVALTTDATADDSADVAGESVDVSDVRDAAIDAPETSSVECINPIGVSWECYDRFFSRTADPRVLATFRCCAGRCVAGTACPQPDAGLPAQCGSEARECDRDAGETCCTARTGTRCLSPDARACLDIFP